MSTNEIPKERLEDTFPTSDFFERMIKVSVQPPTDSMEEGVLYFLVEKVST